MPHPYKNINIRCPLCGGFMKLIEAEALNYNFEFDIYSGSAQQYKDISFLHPSHPSSVLHFSCPCQNVKLIYEEPYCGKDKD